MTRSPRSGGKAIARINADGPTDLNIVAKQINLDGIGPGKLVAWIVRGLLGVHLDGLKGQLDGRWYSSAAAVWRFLPEVAREEEWRTEEAAERAGDLARRGIAPADIGGGLRGVG